MYFVWTWNAMAYRRGIAKISKCSCSQNTLPFAQWRLGVPSCFRDSETQSWCTSEIIGLPHHPSLSKHHAAYAWVAHVFVYECPYFGLHAMEQKTISWSLLHCNAWHVWLPTVQLRLLHSPMSHRHQLHMKLTSRGCETSSHKASSHPVWWSTTSDCTVPHLAPYDTELPINALPTIMIFPLIQWK